MKSRYKINSYDSLKEAVTKHNSLSSDKVINLITYRKWARENGAPSDPRASFKLGSEWSLKDLLSTKKMSIGEYVEFLRGLGIDSRTKLDRYDKSNWDKSIPKSPFTTYGSEFSFNLVKGIVRGSWVPMDIAIEFYKTVVKSNGRELQSVKDIPSNIPRDPVSVYDGFTWSMVTGNTSNIKVSVESREEIIIFLKKHIDLINVADGTLVLTILSFLTSEKISNLIKKKVEKVIMEIVSKKKPGDRKEDVLEVVSQVEQGTSSIVSVVEPNTESNVDEASTETETFDSPEVSEEEDEINVEYRKNARVKAIDKAVQDETINIDLRNLLMKSGVKYLWHKKIRESMK